MMATLLIEGETLGKKHQHYNKLLKQAITATNTSQEVRKINYNETDIDNLLKIDIASNKKDVDYILDVLKSEDMLYVSRTLKQSVWLITDIKYADIINADFIYSKLLPHMSSKAGHKLILSIRLNLKDEPRVEEFYRYYAEKDFTTAIKWLPNCSIAHIEKVVEKRASDIPLKLIKRLCEKSITIMEIYIQRATYFDVKELLSKTTFFINSETEKFVNIMSTQERYALPKLSPKVTKAIMKTNSNVIIENFEKFASKIDIPTFVKFLKRENIIKFLIKQLNNDKIKNWFTFDIIKYFILGMPSESRFEFIKHMFIEKSHDIPEQISYEDDCVQCSNIVPQTSNAKIYKWYKFAPFSIAFVDLLKLIRMETNPSERNEIFAVLIICAKGSSQNLLTVLQYYRDKHMNEPFKFKSHFVNIVLSLSIFHRLDDKYWAILNDIFCSMGVYSENVYNVQTCLKHIIIYKIVRDTKVPDIVEKKFEFDSLKSFQSKLNEEEKDKVFKYLYQLSLTKIQNITVNRESDLKLAVKQIISVLNLLNDWKKNLLYYNVVQEKIKEIMKINDDNSWNENLSGIYNVNKSWRKYMFKESLILHPSYDTCVNALKHGPEILMLSKDKICLNDSIQLSRVLNKLRIYWPDTLAKAFEETFQNHFNINTYQKISVQGLCILLPQNQLIDVLSKYIPTDTKISWTETEDLTLSIQKWFAKYMHLARPHPPIPIVLSYAKGDYLQFALPSLNSILFNLSAENSIEHISLLLDSPVSLQKHGLKIAFSKLKIEDFLLISLNTWKSTKNLSIRATIFKHVFESLCKEQNEHKIKEIWNVINNFIDNLTYDENKTIYVTIGQAKKVPRPIKKDYCIKSYKFLKSLPAKNNCNQLAESVIRNSLDVMEFMDGAFIAEIIYETFEIKFTKSYYDMVNLISVFLLSTKREETQTQRYKQIFLPILKKYMELTKNTDINQFYIKYNFNDILKQIHKDFHSITIKNNMITPIKLFNDFHRDLKNNLSTEDNYVVLITCKLAAIYVEIIDKYREKITIDSPGDNSTDNESALIETCLAAVPDFAKASMQLLREEINIYFPSVYRLFYKALKEIFDRFLDNNTLQLAFLKVIQDNADIIEEHLLVVHLLPNYLSDNKDKEERYKICKILTSHASAEVRMHYYQMLRENGTAEKY